MTSRTPDTHKAWIEWEKLEELASRLSQPGIEPGTIPNKEWQIIKRSLMSLAAEQNWPAVIRLRKIFNALFARDTMTGLQLLKQLNENAITGARLLGDKGELGHLLGSTGHNLHRQGYHLEAIQAFDESTRNYQEIGEEFKALKSYYMTSLCYRALGDREKAKQILGDVLERINPDDPWRANPTQVMAWLLQDEGKLSDAEDLLRQCLDQYRQMTDSDVLIAGALADLAEIVGISGRVPESRELFEESLSILSAYAGQYDRQEARTLLKYSELLIHQKDYSIARKLLDRADNKVSRYGHYYDLLWQIELAQAFLLLQEGELVKCLRKIRSVFRIRSFLRLPNTLFVKHVIQRYAQRFWRAKRNNVR